MKDSLIASLPETGFVRIRSILAPLGPIPVSKSSWWAGVRTGRFPAPVKLDPRTTAWSTEDIKLFIENPERWRSTSPSTPATRPTRRGATAAKANEAETFHDR